MGFGLTVSVPVAPELARFEVVFGPVAGGEAGFAFDPVGCVAAGVAAVFELDGAVLSQALIDVRPTARLNSKQTRRLPLVFDTFM